MEEEDYVIGLNMGRRVSFWNPKNPLKINAMNTNEHYAARSRDKNVRRQISFHSRHMYRIQSDPQDT
jgi:hypothetical protein